MTSETLLNRLHDAATTMSSSYFLQAFSELPNTIKADVSPSRELYGRVADREKSMRFLWISTPGTSTHFHFDQDHNFFAQIVGRKRFHINSGLKISRHASVSKITSLMAQVSSSQALSEFETSLEVC